MSRWLHSFVDSFIFPFLRSSVRSCICGFIKLIYIPYLFDFFFRCIISSFVLVQLSVHAFVKSSLFRLFGSYAVLFGPYVSV